MEVWVVTIVETILKKREVQLLKHLKAEKVIMSRLAEVYLKEELGLQIINKEFMGMKVVLLDISHEVVVHVG